MIVKVLVDARGRWEAGRKAHGGGPWVGRKPVAELYEELLDALNYCDEHERQDGRTPWVGRVRDLVFEAASLVVEHDRG